MAQDFSRHHIIPRSAGGTNARANIVKLHHKYHVALHQVFNNLPPDRQIERILDIASTALTKEFKERIIEILESEPEFIYSRGVLIPK